MQECVLSTDRRSVRTRRALRQALAEEICSTGDLSRVTVTAVTERAGVTRRTFYSHFRDIPDLVRQIEDETLEELDGRAVALMAERAAGRDLTAPEKRSLVSDVVLANRRLRNSEGGYWCLDPTGSGLAHARRLTLPRREVVVVAGMSDGLFRAFGQYGMARLEDELAGLTPRSVRRLVARMRELEASDPLLERFPRLKVGDDASMFWIAP